MNILPIISGFILFLSIGSYALIHSLRSFTEEEIHYVSHCKLQRKLAENIQKDRYKKLFKKNPQKKNNSPSKKKKKDLAYSSPRMRPDPSDQSKFNLACLLHPKKPHLEEAAIHLIRSMYQMSSFYRPHLEHVIYNEIMRILKDHPNISSFEDLFPFVEEEKELFYKIIKGTQKYTFATTVGIPSLGDFFLLDKSNKKPAHFPFASFPVLQAVLGDVTALHIIQEEKNYWEKDHKHKSLTKGNLAKLLQKHGQPFADFEDFFYYSTGKKKTSQYILYDKETKLQLKIDK